MALYGTQSDRVMLSCIAFSPMNWTNIRDHIGACIERGTSQSAVARRGGLSGPDAVSKLLRNDGRGPSVQTLIQTIYGLGLTPAAFFYELERTLEWGPRPADSPSATLASS